MIKLFLFFCVITWTGQALSIETSSQKVLRVGETFEIPATLQQEVRVHGSGIISIEETDSSVIVRGQAIGKATLSIDESSITFTVVPNVKKSDPLVSRLAAFQSERMGVILRSQGSRISVGGELLRLSDYEDILGLSKSTGSDLLVQFEIDEDVGPKFSQFVRKQFESEGLPSPYVVLSGPPEIVLPEIIDSRRSRMTQLADRLGLPIRFEKGQLQTQQMVRVKVVIAEVSKRLQEDFGVDWPDSLQASILPKLAGPKNLDIFLKAVVNKGLGRILASPSLVARSGGEAEFLAGGEVPYRIVTRSLREIHWKRHGIFLKIRPLADRAGRLSIDLSTEISLVDGSTNIEGLPGMKTNKLSTSIDLDRPKTIVLSGLVRQDATNGSNGLTGLANIPVLGQLFRSDNFITMKSELVIFVSPEIDANLNEPTVPSWSDLEDKK